MIQVPGYVVVIVMAVHAAIAFFAAQTTVTFDPIWQVGFGAALVVLNVLANAMKPLTTALRTLGTSANAPRRARSARKPRSKTPLQD